MRRFELPRALPAIFSVATALLTGAAFGQSASSSARIEAVPLQLLLPDRYQVISVLEPIRRVTLVAPEDGVLRSLDARLGETVRESRELAQIDRAPAAARLKVAMAELREKQALVKNSTGALLEAAQAQLEAAEARADLIKLEVDRCTLRAPFAGRILNILVSTGQYVLKGTTIIELADVSSLKTTLPVDRRGLAPNAAITVSVEDRDVQGKIQAILPLSESFSILRELATPFASAAITLQNPAGELEPGLRARPAGVPITPIATIPKRAIKLDAVRNAAPQVQVLRNEHVTGIPVQVLGNVGPDRVQIAGRFRETDVLIVESSIPLLPGTLVRFGDMNSASRAVEGVAPDPSQGGIDAGIVPPSAGGRPGAYGTTSGNGSLPSRKTTGSSPRRGTQTGEAGQAPF